MEPRPDHGEASYRGSGRLAGRKALITGGDSGMGRAAAIAFAREGADVAINYLPDEEPDAREVLDLIKARGPQGGGPPRRPPRRGLLPARWSHEAVEELGGLDILVSNAARQQTRASILDVTSEDFDATMKTNVYAPFWIIKAALPHLQPGSAIIGTDSEQAYDPSAELYDYAQTKAATMNYVKSLAKQLAPKGIRVNGVAPGPIWTPLQVSGGATRRSWRSSAARRRWGGPASRPSWPPSTSSSRPPTPATRPARSTARPAAAASPEPRRPRGAAGGLGRRRPVWVEGRRQAAQRRAARSRASSRRRWWRFRGAWPGPRARVVWASARVRTCAGALPSAIRHRSCGFEPASPVRRVRTCVPAVQ